MSKSKGDKARRIAFEANDTFSRGGVKSWFFGIGIDSYRYFPPLNNAVKDVKDIVGVLKEKYDLDEKFLLFNEEATHDNIIAQLDKLKTLVNPSDKVIIYYSGHGHLDKWEKGYWIPFDAKKENTAQYIRNSTVRDYIEDINSLHTLLISDSCFSGSLFVRGLNRSGVAVDELESKKSRWVICSGRHDEEVFDGPPGKNSPFAESIIEVLVNNISPKLNVGKLTDRVIEMTRSNYKQLPDGSPLFGVGHKGGQYVFRMKFDEENIWEQCCKEHKISAYKFYLDNFVAGKYRRVALEQIKNLEELDDWNKASQIDRIHAYMEFLNRFPRGQYAELATNKIRQLENKLKDKKYDTAKENHFYMKRLSPTRKRIAFGVGMMLLLTLTVLAIYFFSPQNASQTEQDDQYVILEMFQNENTGMYGYKNMLGQIVIEAQYDSAMSFKGEMAQVIKGNKVLYINKKGEVLDEREVAENTFSNNASSIQGKGEKGGPETPKKTENFNVNEKSPEKEEKKTASPPLTTAEKINTYNGYRTFRHANHTWLAENLDLDIGKESWCYNDTNYCKQYGRLYTWKAANEACKKLGPNWRLPSEDDWEDMIKVVQPVTSKIGGTTGSPYVPKGGMRTPGNVFDEFSNGAYYWTSDFSSGNTARAIVFEKGKKKTISQINTYGFSCRCITY